MNDLLNLKQRWMPILCMRAQANEIYCQQLSAQGWQDIALDALPEHTLFSSQVALIADADCSFRLCTYPFDMLDASALDEAVELDLQQWSPFVEAYSYVSFVERKEDCWQVSVWVWPDSAAEHLLALLPDHLLCTHLLPEMAWHVACIRAAEPVLLLHVRDETSHLAFLSALGLPEKLVALKTGVESRRFFRGLGAKLEEVTKVFLTSEASASVYLPETLIQKQLGAAYPRLPLLNRARLAGIQDWSNPMSWRHVIMAAFSLVLLWMAADAFQLMQRYDKIDGQLNRMTQSTHTVLEQRNKVDVLRERLQYFSKQRVMQQVPERLLAELSQKIPKDIWLNSIRFGDRWVDMSGQGKDVARLIVLMEGVTGVKHASFINELRTVPGSDDGREVFQLRLAFQPLGLNE